MAKKYKTKLILISVLLVFACCMCFSYLKYQRYVESTHPLVVVKNGLSINYLQGNKAYYQGEEKVITFSVTNNSSVDLEYYISLDNIVSNQAAIAYNLVEQNRKIEILKSDVSKDYNNLVNTLKIVPGETHFYTLTFPKNENLNFTAKLSVNVEGEKEEYFAKTILKHNEVKKEPLTKIGESVALENEGLIESSTNSGTAYFFRGKTDNNYVNFANMTWRIIRINSDGSVRIILNDYLETMGNFYDSKVGFIKEKMDLTKNKMYNFLTSWYDENLKKYDKNIISNKYCVDDTEKIVEDTLTRYAASQRILEEQEFTPNCEGTNYTGRIGLMSADEVIMAGATSKETNNSYYLHLDEKDSSWWTTTPSTSDGTNIVYFEVKPDGNIVASSIGTYFKSVRPVINLIKKISVNGTGTIEDPYTIK